MKEEKKSAVLKKAVAGLLAAVMMFTPSTVSGFTSAGITASAASSAKAAAKISLSKCTVSVASSVGYTGKALKPAVTVKYKKTKLKAGKDYTVSYSSNTALGTGKVTVKAVKSGNYTGSKTAKFNIVPAKPKVTASSTASSITLSWKKVAGAKSYIVYSYTPSSKKYKKLKTLSSTKYTAKASSGKTYNYAVKAVAKKGSKTYNGILSSVVSVPTKPGKVTSVKITSAGSTSLSLKWKKVSGATGYNVYTYNTSTKKYTLRASTKSTSATIKNLLSLTTYAVCVRAYRSAGGMKASGAMSSYVMTATAPKKAGTVKVKVSGTTAKLSWSKVKGASGYYVYSYSTSSKKYTKLSTVKTNSASVKKLVGGKTYYFAVAAYRTVKNTTAVGTKSSLAKVTTKKINYFDKYYNTFRNGDFYVSYTLDGGDIGNIPVKTYVKNGDVKMITNVLGLDVVMIYYKKSDSGYAYVSFLRKYQKLDSQKCKENAISAEVNIDMFAPQMLSGSSVVKGSATVSGKKCTTYTYKTVYNTSVVYYVNSGELVRIKNAGEIIKIKEVLSEVSSDEFDLPKRFPKGYSKMNMF